ncbi:uncharacterized protein LOC129272807 [Lytechinus pictus]|uniref:uncharacterized protein LOC129272807 n=1 Tax=Lytechinus pictus TaxID=7653 RepID=UPI0030B9D228
MAHPTKEELRQEISQILEGADLSALSSKKVRLKLQDFFKVDLSDRKKEIDQLLMALIADGQATSSAKEKESKDVPQTSGEHSRKKGDTRHSDSSSDELRDGSPPVKRKKKKKKEGSKPATKTKKKEKTYKKETKSGKKREAPKSKANVEDSDDEQTINDEELAWKLHQEESRRSRTRNHTTRRITSVKSKSTSKKVNGASKDKGKRGYSADMILSPELAKIIGTDRLSRHEVVKKMWAIVKERDLVDPKNKQFHICDDELFKVFRRRRIRTFSMMKYLKGHIKDPRNLTIPV